MSFLQAPKAPSDSLRREARRILARLDLIIEFHPWLNYIRRTKHPASTFVLCWETFALGVPLGTLLDLLGSPSPGEPIRDFTIDTDKPDLGLGLPHREKYFTTFIQRVQLLEVQQKIPYGEVLRVQDLFGGTTSGFAKVLKTVGRVLHALQESYPGVFALPKHAPQLREDYIQQLIETERAHIATLRMTGDSAELLSEDMRPINPCLDCLIVNRPPLRQYHDRVLQRLEMAVKTTLKEDWDRIFSFETGARNNAIGAYRSICAIYLQLADILQKYLDGSQALFASHAQMLLNNVSILLTRTSDYSFLLEKILSVTSPAESPTYDLLCNAVFYLREASENLDEMGRLVRTMRSTRIFTGRAFTWRADIDPSQIGTLLLDDVLGVNVSGTQGKYSVFLFEMMFLCCTEELDREQADDQLYSEYPVRAWAFGPALQQKTPLHLVLAIPTSRLKLLRTSDGDMFELDYIDEMSATQSLEFSTTCAEQYDQWHSSLEGFVPSLHILRNPPDSARSSLESTDERAGILSEDEDAGGRRRSHARSWSIIARKGPRSESSSILLQETSDQESLLSPNLLPRFFGPGSQEVSPLAINTTFPRGHLGVNEAVNGLGFLVPPTPPPDSEPYVEADPTTLLDLTGHIRKEGSYPQAHGGFADVWKGVWDRQPDSWVAIKVLRSRLDDTQMERKMNKRLARELSVWKRLDHKHVLKLLGTVSDFGPYDSMVCPWLEQGSVSKYMERRGDILSMTDRLQLLCEVADGLNYLHENLIVHGDLTGSNILIDDDGKARLCDFGLSSIVAEFCGSSSLTSCIGGAVRWADASLYSLSSDDDEESQEMSRPTPRNDIYSYGSVTLEILSGRMPYFYIKTDAQVIIEIHRGNKPRRPAHSFVTDAQWAFIQQCWSANQDERPISAEVLRLIKALHHASLDHRRHTYEEAPTHPATILDLRRHTLESHNGPHVWSVDEEGASP
ncbi:putative TKL/TKL-ccin protein kinase [Favolaschia claudopus]|uniref:TKL/TKL-ccin protein kinase n=1 Tax=Favolaschia claudopus TaxID=2862362 RepID=A0AAV9ZA40_9AGAR